MPILPCQSYNRMYTLRKWFYKPKKYDTSLLALFYYADEDLNLVAAELDSFDGRKDPERCTFLVNQLRACQDRVLNVIQFIMEEAIPTNRANRDFRAKFPDDVIQENLAGQLWFGAECLAAGSSIMNREPESGSMRPLARALTRTLDNLRAVLRDQSLRNVNRYSRRIKEGLIVFDQLFAEFEFSYVSAMVPVKTLKDYEMMQQVIVLCSETVKRAIKKQFVFQDMIDNCDPALMFTIPRLAIVGGLLFFPNGPICPDLESGDMSEMFRPFQNLLLKIRQLLRTLSEDELHSLENTLCSVDEPVPMDTDLLSSPSHKPDVDHHNISNTLAQDDETEAVVEYYYMSQSESKQTIVSCNPNEPSDSPLDSVVDGSAIPSISSSKSNCCNRDLLNKVSNTDLRDSSLKEADSLPNISNLSENNDSLSDIVTSPKETLVLPEGVGTCIDISNTGSSSCSSSSSSTYPQNSAEARKIDGETEDLQSKCSNCDKFSDFDKNTNSVSESGNGSLESVTSSNERTSVINRRDEMPDEECLDCEESKVTVSNTCDLSISDSVCDEVTDCPPDYSQGKHHNTHDPSESSCSTCRSDRDFDEISCGSTDTSSYNSECQDEEEIAMAIQAAEMASQYEARSKFRNSSDLVHRLFVCIAGVADQLQTNYASDLRNILRVVFEMHSTDQIITSPVKSPKPSPTSARTPRYAYRPNGQRQSRAATEPPVWIPDDECGGCTTCKVLFTLVKRRHHCRNCGKIYCSRCSSNFVPLPHFGLMKPVRVCNHCLMYQCNPFTS